MTLREIEKTGRRKSLPPQPNTHPLTILYGDLNVSQLAKQKHVSEFQCQYCSRHETMDLKLRHDSLLPSTDIHKIKGTPTCDNILVSGKNFIMYCIVIN